MNIRRIFYTILLCLLLFRLGGEKRAIAGVTPKITTDTIINETTYVSGSLYEEAIKSNILKGKRIDALQNKIKSAEEELANIQEDRDRINNLISRTNEQIDSISKIDFEGVEKHKKELENEINTQKARIKIISDSISYQENQLQELDSFIKKRYSQDIEEVIQDLWNHKVQYLNTALADMNSIELANVEKMYVAFQDLGLKETTDPSKRIAEMKKLIVEYQKVRRLLEQPYTKSKTHSYYTHLSSTRHKAWKELRNNHLISEPQYDEINNTFIALYHYPDGVYILNEMIKENLQESYFTTSPDANVQQNIENYIYPIPYLHQLFEAYRSAWKSGREEEIKSLNSEISKLAEEL